MGCGSSAQPGSKKAEPAKTAQTGPTEPAEPPAAKPPAAPQPGQPEEAPSAAMAGVNAPGSEISDPQGEGQPEGGQPDVAPSVPAGGAGQALRVLHYNIYVGQGCDEGAELSKLDRLASWLAEKDCDVVGLCECNGWQGWDVDTLKNKLGYPHAAMQLASKKTRGHVMILSKSPIEVIEHPELGLGSTDGVFFHALIHVKTAGIHFMETHLCPRHAKGRLKELEAAMEIVQSLSGEPLLFMGDMNSIMPSSKGSVYSEEELIGLFRGADPARLVANWVRPSGAQRQADPSALCGRHRLGRG